MRKSQFTDAQIVGALQPHTAARARALATTLRGDGAAIAAHQLVSLG
jgi:hypothetical protein